MVALPGGKFPSRSTMEAISAYRQSQQISQKLATGAVVAYPTDDLQSVLSQASGTQNEGPIILLSPGTWDFSKTLNLTRKNTQIVALSPSRTIFRRLSNAVTSGPLISVQKSGCSISGIVIQDDWGADNSQNAIELLDSEFTLERVRVDNCFRVMEVTGEAVIRVANCDFYGYSDNSGPQLGILRFTSCQAVIVTGNFFSLAYPIGVPGSAAIWFDDSSTYCAVSANTNFGGTVLSRKTPAVARVEEAANTYVVETRP